MNFSEGEELFSDGISQVLLEKDGLRTLHLYGPWSGSAEAVAKRFNVNGLHLTVALKGNGQSLDFLVRLPDLVYLHIPGSQNTPWDRLESLSKLRVLSVSCDASSGEPCNIDFSRFKQLTSCTLVWKTAWTSVLEVRTLRQLTIRNAIKLPALDCRSLESLEELGLLGCIATRTISLADSSRLRKLVINGTQKLSPVWERLGRDLEYLEINGKVAFGLEELRYAQKLKCLSLWNVGKVPSLKFLHDLPALECVEALMGNTISDSDRKLISAINKSDRANKLEEALKTKKMN